MAVPEQTPYIEHTGNGATTSFALKFQCESKDHLIVLVDEIEPPIETWSLTGGNVVFTTAPAAGKKITAQRNTPFSRNGDYQSYNNSFRPPAVNKDFDWIWWKLQELGVADWILGARIDALKNYVDRKDDELKAYLMEEIRKQGVALDQLDDYYNYLMKRLAQIAVDKGWDASFVVDGDENQHQINNQTIRFVESIADLLAVKNPKNGQTAYVKSYYHANNLALAKPYIGGNTFVYASNVTHQVNGGTVLKPSESNGRWFAINLTYVAPEMFGAKCDGAFDDSDALISADSVAYLSRLNLVITSKLNITKAVTLKSLIADTKAQLFNQNKFVTVNSGQPLRPEWWGADGTTIANNHAALDCCFANAQGKAVQLGGYYHVHTPLVIDFDDKNGLRIYGETSSLVNINTPHKYGFCFDNMPTNEAAITFRGTRGLKLADFHIAHNTGRSDSSVTVWFTEFDMFDIDSLTIESTNGVASTALRFGLTGGVDSVFMGTLRTLEWHMNGGCAVDIRPACTSINHINCYSQRGYFSAHKATYIKYDNTASEGNESHGFVCSSSAGVTYITCGGEANKEGVFKVVGGSAAVQFVTPTGINNNTSGSTTVGSLITIDGTSGANSSISISTPSSLANHANTVADILGIGVNGFTEIQCASSGALLKGVAGRSDWMQNYVTITGDAPHDNSFLVFKDGFTGDSTLSATYSRLHKTLSLSITVTTTSQFSTTGASEITLSGFVGIEPTIVSVIGADGVNYGNALLIGNVITMPVITNCTTAVYLRASAITDL